MQLLVTVIIKVLTRLARNLFQTISVLPSRPLLSEALAIFREEIRAIQTVEGLTPNFICYPLHSNAIAEMKQRGGNALGIDQEGPLFSMLTLRKLFTLCANEDNSYPTIYCLG